MAAEQTTAVPKSIPLPSAANLVNPVDKTFFFTFPPFPTVPEGVTIMPFKEFKEGGICIEAGADEEEVDTLGIPTVPIHKRHDIDQCKTNAKRKRKAEKVKAKKTPVVQKLWWEQWDDTEASRFSPGFNL